MMMEVREFVLRHWTWDVLQVPNPKRVVGIDHGLEQASTMFGGTKTCKQT